MAAVGFGLTAFGVTAGFGFGLTASAEFTNSYPVTVNDQAEAQFAAQVVTDVLGERRYVPQPNPMAGAEDFFYWEKINFGGSAIGWRR